MAFPSFLLYEWSLQFIVNETLRTILQNLISRLYNILQAVLYGTGNTFYVVDLEIRNLVIKLNDIRFVCLKERMENVQKTYWDQIKDLEPLKLARPPKPVAPVEKKAEPAAEPAPAAAPAPAPAVVEASA